MLKGPDEKLDVEVGVEDRRAALEEDLSWGVSNAVHKVGADALAKPFGRRVVSEWWPWATALVALSVLLRTEPRRNLRAFLTSRPMGPDDDWPETRVKATMEAYARITSYAHERRERFHQYESNWTRTRFRVVER